MILSLNRINTLTVESVAEVEHFVGLLEVRLKFGPKREMVISKPDGMGMGW